MPVRLIKDSVSIYTGHGLLYNWVAATYAVGGASIAPVGWHLPSKIEYDTLSTFLGGNAVSGGPLKETGTDHWNAPNTGATNTSGFTGRGIGERLATGAFSGVNLFAYFWTSYSIGGFPSLAVAVKLSNTSTVFDTLVSTERIRGKSIRLIKDDALNYGSMTDYDGNVYTTSKIGTQVWMDTNLKVTHYNDGTLIPELTAAAAWIADTAGARCWYNNIPE